MHRYVPFLTQRNYEEQKFIFPYYFCTLDGIDRQTVGQGASYAAQKKVKIEETFWRKTAENFCREVHSLKKL